MPDVNGDLYKLVQAATSASQSPALRVDIASEERRPADWLRFLSGSALAAPEIESGIAVPRRLATAEGDKELPEVLEWLGRRRGRTIFLRGDAGEGKSTYLSLLSRTLRGSAMVFTWAAGLPLTIDEVLTVVETVRSMPSSSTAAPSAVVLAELRPGLSDADASTILTTLQEHEDRADDTVFLVAGRPAAVDSLAARTGGAEICSLASINATEASAICRQIERAYEQAAKTLSMEHVSRMFPNLLAFLALPEDAQAAHFAQSSQSLIVGFLKAVYGNDFVQRLVGEYRRLDAMGDRRAYLHVCLATVAGLDLPERALRALAPTADLDARSNYDPWVRTGDDGHVARHPLIAQTVLEAAKDYSALSQCFDEWIGLTRQQPDTIAILYQVVAGVAYMRPLARSDGRVGGRVRKRLADALGADATLLNRLVLQSGSNAARLFSWGHLLRAVLPAQPPSDSVTLLGIIIGLYDAALDPTVGASWGLGERLEYNRDCAVRDIAVATSVTESVEEIEDRIVRWRDFIGRDWADARFYANLFDTARDLALALTIGQVVERDSDIAYLAYATSGEAYQHLIATGDTAYSDSRFVLAGELLHRYVNYALPTRYLDVQRRVWEVAWELRSHGSPGIFYAYSLVNSPGGREQSRIDEAVDVLKKAMELSPNNVEAIHQLAGLAAKRRDVIPLLKERIDRLLPGAEKSRRAVLHSSAALIEDDVLVCGRHLEAAIEAYSQVDWDGAQWDRIGDRWASACAKLRRLGKRPDACGRALDRVRSRMQRVKR